MDGNRQTVAVTEQAPRSFVQTTVRVAPGVYARVLEAAAADLGPRSVNAWIEQAIAEKLARSERRRRLRAERELTR